MKKLANHIILSGVTVSMLLSPMVAADKPLNPNHLPSGGKFTHGTSGTININGNNMDIMGKGPNSVIQWGGGFSIGKDAQVNFNGSNKNYLNIAHGTSKSMIEGILNAGGNNVFLINPNGVIIEKSGSIINANRFVASTSSMDSESMQAFADMKTLEQGAAFSPVFKPNPKGGNVINMGNINANDVLLIGNKVSIDGGKLGNKNSTTHLVGKNVYIDADSTNLNSTINVTATEGGYIQRQMIKFANSGYNFGNNVKVNVVNYKDSSGATHIGSSNFKKVLTIGNMGNEKDNAIEWWHFAKGWNEDLGVTRSIDEFRLVGNIDFSGNKGQGTEGKDWQNYANYWVDLNGDGVKQDNEFTNMIVGWNVAYDIGSMFTKTFDGQGYTLKNINIDTTKLDNKPTHVGIFGYFRGTAKNVNVDYMGGSIVNPTSQYAGGFTGVVTGGYFSNISINNIGNIAGGENVGGFAGVGHAKEAFNISVNNIESIETLSHEYGNAGGFAASFSGYISNISINNIGNIAGGGSAGGFLSYTIGGYFSNISINNIGNIAGGEIVGGFIGHYEHNLDPSSEFKNIFIFFKENTKISGGQVGKFFGKIEKESIKSLSNIHVYHHENDLSNAIADQNYWGNTNDKIQIHTYNDSNKDEVYKDFKNKANTISKPMLPIMPPPSKPTDPSNPDVILDSDDLYSDIIMEWIIDELRKENYTIDIKNLVSLINAFKGLDKDSSENEIKAVIKTHLGIKDDDKALSMAQGISFLLNYQEHNFDGRLNDEALAAYNNTIKPSVNNTLGLISYLDKNKDYLLEQYNKHKELEQVFKDKEQAYKNAEAEFNRLLDLVNKGKLSYNDPKFTQAFDNWLNAYNAYNALSNDISELNNNVEKIANYITDENKGLAYTQFSFVKFDDISKIDLVKPELPDIDNSQGGDLPDFEQTASLNLIGDNALEEEDEKKEIDEASLMQKSKTCIVSDNYKTMNPCVVGGL
ncbi:filamentous hemagglutinin N-terminal domain-containing protein [Campylobacter lari]|nr:filamentous hemagglutinin N-terminal domain-containing protein [Campylobacter lari]